eukprot:12040625-Alexandrium_andersonii.AAC.3
MAGWWRDDGLAAQHRSAQHGGWTRGDTNVTPTPSRVNEGCADSGASMNASDLCAAGRKQ